MKEPSVSVKMIVEPSVQTTVSDINISSGVIVSNQGAPLKYFNNATDLLKEYTPTGVITRDTDPTLIHAYAICKFMPVLVSRSMIDNGTKSGKAIVKDGTTQSQVIFKKSNAILDEQVPIVFHTAPSLSGNYALQVGINIYYIGTAPVSIPTDCTAVSLGTVTSIGTALESFTNAINAIDPLFHLEKVTEGTVNDIWSASYRLHGETGSTTPDVDNRWDNDAAYEYTWASVASVSKSTVLAYLFANNQNSINFTGKITANSEESTLIDLVVTTPSKTYEYTGSVNPNYLNAYGVNQYIENINDYTGIEFEIQVGDTVTNNTFTASSTISFGAMFTIPGTNAGLRTKAFERITDQDQYKPAFYNAYGYNNPSYINSMITAGMANYSFVPVGLFTYKNDSAAIIASAPTTKSNASIVIAVHDRNTGVADFPVDLSAEVAYLQRIKDNKSIGREFAPIMSTENGTIPFSKPSITLSKSVREALLDSNVMSVIYVPQNNLSYLNKNKTTSTQSNVLSEEQNTRLAFKINRDGDTLMRPFLGQYNDVPTRSRVNKAWSDYISNNITNQIYSLNKITVTCDETNNPVSVQQSGKLVVTVKAVYNNTIYEVIVYHRVFDLNNA